MRVLWPEAPLRQSLSADELQVWAVPTAHPMNGLEDLWPLLCLEEQQRADRFALEEPWWRFVFGRAALRTLLGEHLGLAPPDVPLELDTNGKPQLGAAARSIDLHFNVAHSAELALIAITSGCEVGVDIECVRPVRHARHIAERYFHPLEIVAIAAAPPTSRDLVFMRCWTAKEAVLKALGAGITGSLSHFCVPTDAFNGTWIELSSARCWLQPLAPAEGYVGGVSCVAAQRQLRCFSFQMERWRFGAQPGAKSC